MPSHTLTNTLAVGVMIMQLISLLFFREGNNKAGTIIKPLEINLSGSNTLALSLPPSHTGTHTHHLFKDHFIQNLVEGIILRQFCPE